MKGIYNQGINHFPEMFLNGHHDEVLVLYVVHYAQTDVVLNKNNIPKNFESSCTLMTLNYQEYDNITKKGFHSTI